jgi:protein SCO1/2
VKSLASRFKENEVHFVSISVDSKRDTPARLGEYRKKFTTSLPAWHMLAAPDSEVARIQQELRVASGKLPDNHTTRMILVDTSGIIRGYYRALEESEIARLGEDIAALIASDPATDY